MVGTRAVTSLACARVCVQRVSRTARRVLQADRWGWDIMRHMGIAEMGVVVLFIIAVALAVWWAVVSLRR